MSQRRPRPAALAYSQSPRNDPNPFSSQVERSTFSAPEFREGQDSRAPQARPQARTPRATTKAASRSSIFSPQLPPHPRGSRLSIRPSPLHSLSTLHGNRDLQDVDGDGWGDNQSDEEDADAFNEVIMAIDMKDNGTLGCAYYVAADESMFLLEDVAMAGVEVAETLLLHARPTTVLVTTRIPQPLLDVLDQGCPALGAGDQNATRGAYIMRRLKSSDFRYESGREKLLGLHMHPNDGHEILFTSVVDEAMEMAGGENEQHCYARGSLMRLGASINLDSRLTVGCAGAVLGDIQRRKTAQYLPNDPDALVAFRIRSVKTFTLFDSMFINADTMMSLQIIQSESHPNSQMRGPGKSASGAKENLSVYGLFHFLACTPQGRQKLRRIFLRPSISIYLIMSRQKTISFFSRPENTETASDINKNLRKIKDMRSVIANLRKGVDSPGRKVSVHNNVWASFQRFALYMLKTHEALRQMSGVERISLVRKVIESIEPRPLMLIGELISQTIDFDQSRERERTAVKAGVDAALDEMKRKYDGMEDLLTEVNGKLRSDLPEWAQKYVRNCVFMPQLGFLTVVSLNSSNGEARYEGEGLHDVWERMFVDGENVYCKNRRMKEMDDQCGDTYCMIIDRELEILHELAVRVLEHEEAIQAASEAAGELDSLLALASGSQRHGWVAPEMSDENILHIEGGRHPLQELVVPAFIENDCTMSGGCGAHIQGRVDRSSVSSVEPDDSPSSLVLTGPNHSGKSVYLKQVALIVYLAHVGCYVPAGRARIGITDRILTRIATRESVSKRESAFAIDLRQVAFAMNFATRRSLVLVDEFGKGTNSQDGAGLLTALLTHFTHLGAERPKVIAATHFHETFEGGFLSESSDLAFAHMDVRVDFDAAATEDQVTHLFKLVPGRSTSSFGSRCAALNGIDAAVVERAETIMLLLARNEDLEAACAQLSDKEAERLSEAEAVARAFLERDIEPPRGGHGSRKMGSGYRGMLEMIMSAESSTSDNS